MQITIDTQNLSSLDTEVLRLLTGEKVAESATEPAPAKKAEEKPAPKPKPKGAAKKAAAAKKDKPEPEPEPEPEPMAEEPVEDEPEEPEEEAEETDEDEEQSDEDLLDLAVKKGTEMVAAGDAAKVREALEAAGASRVRELNQDNVREFFKALS